MRATPVAVPPTAVQDTDSLDMRFFFSLFLGAAMSLIGGVGIGQMTPAGSSTILMLRGLGFETSMAETINAALWTVVAICVVAYLGDLYRMYQDRASGSARR